MYSRSYITVIITLLNVKLNNKREKTYTTIRKKKIFPQTLLELKIWPFFADIYLRNRSRFVAMCTKDYPQAIREHSLVAHLFPALSGESPVVIYNMFQSVCDRYRKVLTLYLEGEFELPTSQIC